MEKKKAERQKSKKAIRTKNGFRVTHINRRRACRLMCVECLGWEKGFNVEIDACNGKMLDGTVCALVDYRDMTGTQNAVKRNKAIRTFCLECMGGSPYAVNDCVSVYCPMYPYRSVRTDKSTLYEMSVPDKVVLEMTKITHRRLIERLSKTLLQEVRDAETGD